MDVAKQRVDLRVEFVRERQERVPVGQHARALHAEQHARERHFHVLKQSLEIVLLKSRLLLRIEPQKRRRGEIVVQRDLLIGAQRGEREAAPLRVDHIACQHRVEHRRAAGKAEREQALEIVNDYQARFVQAGRDHGERVGFLKAGGDQIAAQPDGGVESRVGRDAQIRAHRHGDHRAAG